MTLVDRLRAIVAAVPPSGSVTLPVSDLAVWIEQEATPVPATPGAEPDTLLNAEQVAERLNLNVRWIYDHADQLGVRRLSRRCVRFSSRAVERYLTRRAS